MNSDKPVPVPVPVPLNDDCVLCHAQNEQLGEVDGTVVLLMMLVDGITAEDVHRDLCFAHRRRVDDNVAAMRKERRR